MAGTGVGGGRGSCCWSSVGGEEVVENRRPGGAWRCATASFVLQICLWLVVVVDVVVDVVVFLCRGRISFPAFALELVSEYFVLLGQGESQCTQPIGLFSLSP
jgi:hypothetical protein